MEKVRACEGGKAIRMEKVCACEGGKGEPHA
jgi:hypothetical protein